MIFALTALPTEIASVAAKTHVGLVGWEGQ
jgi:hypothetical protein